MTRLLLLMTTSIIAMSLCTTVFAQTATPSALPPMPIVQSTVDRSGVDRSTGTISDVNSESVAIGNKFSSLWAGYDSEGGFPYASYIQLERVNIYSGGFMVARVAARGTVHVFSLGTITQTTYPAGCCGHTAWYFNNYGTSTSTSTSDTYNDYNNDGAILVCSGPASQMYRGGTCSVYLGSDGSRTDFRMPAVKYDLNLRSWWPGNATPTQLAFAWPVQVALSDGEVLTYSYVNYGEWDAEEGKTPGPTKWNAVDSSLGFRVYLSGGTPTVSSNPGAFYPPGPGGGSASLYAINTSQEYADPLTLNRTFSLKSFSSVRNAISNGYTLVNNGVTIESITSSSSAPIGVTLTKPNGGSIFYAATYLSNAYYTGHGINGGASSPPGAFPFSAFSVTKNSTTSYSITYDNVNFIPERYQGTVTNPDGSTESFTVRYGLLYSQTDGLGHTTTFGWTGAEGYFYGIPGYARLAKLQSVNRPNGSSMTYTYSHGAVSSTTVNPAGGGAGLTTTVGLPSSCTVTNYRICNKPTYIQDPKGNQTDYTYDPAHGGILTETLPPDANGVRAQKRYTYNLLYPKVLNANGVLVNSTPVWRVTRVSECLTAIAANPASCVGTAAERVTTYAYNDNNLFLTSIATSAGDGSLSTTTSSTYDYAGNVTSIDGPRTDVDDRTYATYDALRRPVFEIGVDPDGVGALPRQVIHHVYDADGNEVRTEYGTGNATDGSDFTTTRFKRMTYDPVTGQKTKEEVVVP